MEISPIKNRRDYRRTLKEIEGLMRAKRNTPEGEGNMLDRTLVLWGSAHPHGSHSTKNYPIQLAGGNHLGLKHGQLHSFEGTRKVPLANLFLTMLHSLDISVTAFADSNAPITEVLG